MSADCQAKTAQAEREFSRMSNIWISETFKHPSVGSLSIENPPAELLKIRYILTV